MARARATATLGALGLLAGCGPTPDEVGRNVFAMAPVAYVVVMLALALLAKILRPRFPEAGVVGRDHRWPLAGSAVLAVPAALTTDLSWFPAVLLFAGSFFVLVALLAWRVWLAVRPATAWTHAPLVAFPTLLPAVPLALGLVHEQSTAELLSLGWIFGGHLGLPALAAFALLVVDAFIMRNQTKPDEA